jgi:hypothetical protein
MICRPRPGFLDVRSVTGDAAYEVPLGAGQTVAGAALDDAGERLALALTAAVRGGSEGAVDELTAIALRTGERRRLREGWATGPVWFPGQDGLAFSDGTSICMADAATGSVDNVFRFSRDPQGPPSIRPRPDGRGLAFLKWVGDDRRIGLVDLDAREGRLYPVSCFSYCWWDERTIVFALGSGLKLLDVASGKSRTWLRDLHGLDRSGVLEALGGEWAEAVRADGSHHDLHDIVCAGGRAYFGARVTFPVARRRLVPLGPRTDYRCVEGLLSVNRDRADLRLYLEGETREVVPLDGGRTLAVEVLTHPRVGRTEARWVFLGEGSGAVPEGSSPLPKAAYP